MNGNSESYGWGPYWITSAQEEIRKKIESVSEVLGYDIVVKLIGLDDKLIKAFLVESADDPAQILNFRVIASVENLIDLGLKLMSPEEFKKWFITPVEELENKSPLDFIVNQEPFSARDWFKDLENALSATL